MLGGRAPKSRIAVKPLPQPSRRRPGSSPKTARRMISRVSRLQQRMKLDGSPRGQLADLSLGDLGDQVRQPLHPLAVEGPEHQLALLQVVRLVEQDDRVSTDDRLQDPAPSPGWSTSGGAVNSSLTASGSVRITNGGAASRRIVNRFP